MDRDDMRRLPRGDDLGSVLFLVFRPRLVLALANVRRGDEYYLGDECLLGGKHYQDKGYGGITDFSDWLRDSLGRVVGIRFWPYEEMHFLSEFLRRFPYVAATGNGERLEIYFSRGLQIDEEVSADQDFATNKVYSSAEGEWAMSFRVTHLSAKEMEGVYTADADWVPARVSVSRAY